MFLFPILFFILSVYLLYQGLCYYGILNYNMLVIDKFSDNSFLAIIRLVLSNYAIMIGILGLAITFCLVVMILKGKLEDLKSFIGLLVFYLLMSLFILI